MGVGSKGGSEKWEGVGRCEFFFLASREVRGLGGERLLVGKGRLWRWEESRCKYFLCMENVNLCFAAANSIMIPKHFVFHLQ